jgi:hypothetical protein
MFNFVTRVVHFLIEQSTSSKLLIMFSPLRYEEQKMTLRQQQSSVNEPATAKVSRLKKYAVIAGQRVALPVDAKFYFQDKRGLWFWSTRKPRVMDGDWTANKSPVQVNDEKGFDRCLITPITDAPKDTWRSSVMQAVNLDNRPLAMSPQLDDLAVSGGG